MVTTPETSPSYFGDYSDRYQPTYNTVADYVTDAREILQDKIPEYRYQDESLLTALNITMAEARRLRPDLFVYDLQTKGQVQAFTAIDATYVKIEVPFRLAIVHGMIGHALERDSEDYMDQRASSFLNMFSLGLTGRGLPGAPGLVGGSGPGRQAQGQGPAQP